MKQLFEHRYLVRKNLMTLVCLGLCFYFSYHLAFGQRSYVRFMSLQNSISSLNQENDKLVEERKALETRVAMLRSSSLNKDMLEERVRIVLGYREKGEKDIFVSDHQ